MSMHAQVNTVQSPFTNKFMAFQASNKWQCLIHLDKILSHYFRSPKIKDPMLKMKLNYIQFGINGGILVIAY